mgnify:CR=1 FL=1|jgi:hypothetical protein|tara:strand:+ start:253 stop:519 length:267 start_codon:yes stop_codon:yes gene_type:complete
MKKEKPFPDNPYSQRNLIKFFLDYVRGFSETDGNFKRNLKKQMEMLESQVLVQYEADKRGIPLLQYRDELEKEDKRRGRPGNRFPSSQ